MKAQERLSYEIPTLTGLSPQPEAMGHCVTGTVASTDPQICTTGERTANQHRCNPGSDTGANNSCDSGANATAHACVNGGDTKLLIGCDSGTEVSGACGNGTKPT